VFPSKKFLGVDETSEAEMNDQMLERLNRLNQIRDFNEIAVDYEKKTVYVGAR
jgi:hypothetical protein